ncbi:MAG: hypothetical protein ACOWWO_14610 [Peptococcaceae bacterium]
MELLSTPLQIPQEKFIEQAQGKGGLLGRMIVKEDLHDLKLEYWGCYKITLTYELDTRKFIFGKKKIAGIIEMVVDGRTGSCAVLTEKLTIVRARGNIFSKGCFSIKQEEAVQRARQYATRILFRRYRGLPSFCKSETATFYRPFWIAYYGNPQECSKPRFLPFEADGMTFKR